MGKTQRRGRRLAVKKAGRRALSPTSMRQAFLNLEQSLNQRDKMESIAQRLARNSGRTQLSARQYREASRLLSKSLTLRDQKFRFGANIRDVLKDFPTFWLASLYVPDAPGVNAPPSQRYSVDWTSSDPPFTKGIGPQLIQVRSASKTDGYVGVANAIPTSAALGGRTQGYAEAAVGILYKPRHALSRVTFVPEAQYRYEWIIDTNQKTPTLRMRNAGWLQLFAQRLNPVSEMWETYLQRSIEIWQGGAGNWGGPAPVFVNETHGGAEAYPGSDPGLQLIATNADTLLLWFIVATYVESDQGPTCMNKLEVSVPLMWVWDESLT